MLSIQLLGAPLLLLDGQPLSVPRRKSRALLFNGFLVVAVITLITGCATSEERKRKKEAVRQSK